jgi:hypothetical protein
MCGVVVELGNSDFRGEIFRKAGYETAWAGKWRSPTKPSHSSGASTTGHGCWPFRCTSIDPQSDALRRGGHDAVRLLLAGLKLRWVLKKWACGACVSSLVLQRVWRDSGTDFSR